jgi:hypothetical protein
VLSVGKGRRLRWGHEGSKIQLSQMSLEILGKARFVLLCFDEFVEAREVPNDVFAKVDNNVNDSRLQPRQPRGSLQSRRGRLAQGEANKNKDNANVLPRDLSSVIINTVRDTGDRVSPAKRIQFANQMMQSNQNLMQPSSKPQLQSSVNFLPLFASSKPILTPSNPQQCYFEEWLLLSQTEQRSDHRVMEPTNCK